MLVSGGGGDVAEGAADEEPLAGAGGAEAPLTAVGGAEEPLAAAEGAEEPQAWTVIGAIVSVTWSTVLVTVPSAITALQIAMDLLIEQASFTITENLGSL